MTRSGSGALLSALAAVYRLLVPAAPGADAVHALHAALAGASGPGSGSATDLIVPVGLLACVGVVAAYSYARRRHRTETRTTPGGGGGGWGAAAGGAGWGTPKEPPAAPLDALDHRTRRALVAADDAVLSSQEELGVVAARFDATAVEPFTEAVAFARGEVAAAFELRQQLDDDVPEDDATRRALLHEILRRCADAQSRLDAESAAFDRLRDLGRTAPEALAAVEAAFRRQAGRVATAEGTLRALRERHPSSAAAPVSDHVEQAKDRLVFATLTVNQARQRLDEGRTGAAVVLIRAAEGAVDQTARLTGAVDRRARELAEASDALPGARAAAEADLADLSRDGTGTADPRGRIRRAASALAEVRTAVDSGRYDPVDVLRRVTEAGAALDQALADGRRARPLLGPATRTAACALGAAGDYVVTHRGAVGAEARTRLAEARRRLDRSARLAGPDPRSALTEAQCADRFARRAQDLAEQDVRRYGNPNGLGGGADGAAGAGGAGLGGAVLGGIVVAEDDAHGDVRTRGFGGPVGFGGAATRRRLGDTGPLF